MTYHTVFGKECINNGRKTETLLKLKIWVIYAHKSSQELEQRFAKAFEPLSVTNTLPVSMTWMKRKHFTVIIEMRRRSLPRFQDNLHITCSESFLERSNENFGNKNGYKCYLVGLNKRWSDSDSEARRTGLRTWHAWHLTWPKILYIQNSNRLFRPFKLHPEISVDLHRSLGKRNKFPGHEVIMVFPGFQTFFPLVRIY